MITRFLTVFLMLFTSLSGFSQTIAEEKLQEIITKTEYSNATVGIEMVKIESGEKIIELNPEKLLVPASVLKIITSASALEILGSGYRFKTEIGFTGEIQNTGVLNGNLVLIGGGDPTLGSEYFKENNSCSDFIDIWIQKIKDAGIKKITGDIIFDSSIYNNEKVPPTWIWGDIGNYYGAGPNAFTCYDNSFSITFKSPDAVGAKTEIISVNPEIKGLELNNEVVSSDDNRDLASVFGSPFDKKRIIRGTIPKNRSAFTIKAAVHHPEELIAEELMNKLTKEGISFEGKPEFRSVERILFHDIYVHESPELSEIMTVLNHESVNLFAEHLIMQIAAEKTGVGDREKGIELIKQFWKSNGTLTEDFFMEDGNGLSHFNAVSPGQIASILVFMNQKSKNSDIFLNSLPNAGTGTLKSFNTEYFPGNTMNAKSGSMTRVRCYAGYLKLNSGNRIAFAIMFNNFSGSGGKAAKNIEELLYRIKEDY